MTEEQTTIPDAEALDTEAGDGDVTEGQANQADAGITLEQLKELSGREFKSMDEFQKHYNNLKSFAGKVNQQPKETAPAVEEVRGELRELKAQIEEGNFLNANPTATTRIDLVKAVAKDKGITLAEAWDKHVKELADGYEAHQKDTGIGVKPTNRLNPVADKENLDLVNAAKSGSDDAQVALVRKMLLKK